MNKMVDILIELPIDKLVQMQVICKEHLPKSVRAHHFLYNFIRWSNEFGQMVLTDRCRFKFYGHRYGDVKNCSFIALSGEEDYIMFAYTLQETGEELQECLSNSKIIKWELQPMIVSMELQHLKILHSIFLLDCLFYVPTNLYYLPKEKALEYNVEVPDNCYLSTLEVSDAKTIDDIWPHRSEKSLDFVKTLITTNGGVGLYSSETNKLLSSIIICENFCPSILQTTEEERRKGYAEIVTKALSRLIAEKYGLDILLFVIKVNTPAIRLCNKLGFQKINSCTWLRAERLEKLQSYF